MVLRLGWWVLAFLVSVIGIYAFLQVALPAVRGELVLGMFAYSPVGSMLHFTAGGIVIVAGVLQFSKTLRNNHPGLHRYIGRLYVAGVTAGGVAGLYMAFNSTGGVVTHFGFSALALCWLGVTWKAFVEIRRGNVIAHRAWMLRSYALTLAALTLRVYIPVFLAFGIPFEEAYPAIAWLCWVPNILIVEWLLLQPTADRAAATGRALEVTVR